MQGKERKGQKERRTEPEGGIDEATYGTRMNIPALYSLALTSVQADFPVQLRKSGMHTPSNLFSDGTRLE